VMGVCRKLGGKPIYSSYNAVKRNTIEAFVPQYFC